ncbi:hypothetical protein FQR65_LT07470 [Abscondita terminalis]|nr:hypothetical protein FQR65_LT07470 [Abscondita terminalis]
MENITNFIQLQIEKHNDIHTNHFCGAPRTHHKVVRFGETFLCKRLLQGHSLLCKSKSPFTLTTFVARLERATEAEKLWGGRFNSFVSDDLEELNRSITIDKKLYAEDIEGSKAYATSLLSINLLSKQECHSIIEGLEKIKLEWDLGTFLIKKSDEDIHTANERRLRELIGEPASKLHVGRSRNDQVVTDMKLWLRSNLRNVLQEVVDLIQVMVTRSASEIDVLMPGYTHLQRAQPVRWSHWLLSHAWSLKEDVDRLQDLLKRINVMPLGSGALAGNPFNIDREALAKSLGFTEPTKNSMHAVADRDFIAEFLFWCSLVGIHLSRLAEDLIIFSTKEFEYITVHDAFSTGSSLMPQKKNPDSLELIRGISGSIFGQCCGFMMTLKGLPSTYNKDLQSDKEAMFKAFEKLHSTIKVAKGTVSTMKLNSEKCRNSINYEMLATDVAYYLVKKNVPFREAHHIAGRVVADAELKKKSIDEMTVNELKSISEQFDDEVEKIWNFEHSVEQYQVTGGTSKNGVLYQICLFNKWIKNL